MDDWIAITLCWNGTKLPSLTGHFECLYSSSFSESILTWTLEINLLSRDDGLLICALSHRRQWPHVATIRASFDSVHWKSTSASNNAAACAITKRSAESPWFLTLTLANVSVQTTSPASVPTLPPSTSTPAAATARTVYQGTVHCHGNSLMRTSVAVHALRMSVRNVRGTNTLMTRSASVCVP